MGCSVLKRSSYEEQCKSRAYLSSTFRNYLGERFKSRSPVRLGVVPFSVPANLASRSNEFPGLGNRLAWDVKNELMTFGELTVVEVLNRQDWPRKKEEFFTGNYGALSMAQQNGYDLIMLGYVDDFHTLSTMTVHTKIIEVSSGITVWNTRNTVSTRRAEYRNMMARYGWDQRRPDLLHTEKITEAMVSCIVDSAMKDPEEELTDSEWLPSLSSIFSRE
jgi:hypothetical protein